MLLRHRVVVTQEALIAPIRGGVGSCHVAQVPLADGVAGVVRLLCQELRKQREVPRGADPVGVDGDPRDRIPAVVVIAHLPANAHVIPY